MQTLHIANKNYSSWSLRPWVLMKTLGIPFAERLWPFAEGPSESVFRQFSPSAKVPCLHEGAVVVWDSMAIVEYLAEQHPAVWPTDRSARAWARSAAAEMHSGFQALRNECTMTVGQRIRLHAPSGRLAADVARIEALWNEGLTRFSGPFLAGANFTAVDAFFAPVAYRVRTYGLALAAAAADYAERLLRLPAMREWEAAALAEPWRDAAHEAEALSLGEILADFRVPTAG
jgi:glutathione S-transferase